MIYLSPFPNNHNSHQITNNTFNSSKACHGALFYSYTLSLTISNSIFEKSCVNCKGILYFYDASVTFYGANTFKDSVGSLFFLVCNISFHGIFVYEDGLRPGTNDFFLPIGEGGALTSLLSNIIFAGMITFVNCQGEDGGAMIIIESKLSIPGNTTFSNNTATNRGDAIYLYQSTIEFQQVQVHLEIANNIAKMEVVFMSSIQLCP